MEKRILSQPARLRNRADGEQPVITGYAAVFYRAGDRSTEYELWPGAVERIMPSAFAQIDEDDVRAMFDHRELLGRRAAGTLRLDVDNIGLRYEIEPSETSSYRDTAEHVRLGNVTGSSFSYRIRGGNGEKWHVESSEGRTVEVREIHSVSVFDVGPVVNPAYTGTSAGARSGEAFAEARAARDRWEDEIKAERDRIAQERAARQAYLRKCYLTQRRISTK